MKYSLRQSIALVWKVLKSKILYTRHIRLVILITRVPVMSGGRKEGNRLDTTTQVCRKTDILKLLFRFVCPARHFHIHGHLCTYMYAHA